MRSEGNNEPLGGSSVGSRQSGLGTVVFLSLSIALTLLANVWKDNLQTGEVTVRGSRIISEAELKAMAGIERKKPLCEIDLFQVQRQLLKNPFVKKASVARESPGRILLTVVERTPVAAIAVGRVHFLDEEGYVLPPVLSEEIMDLPVITGHLASDGLVVGRKIHTSAGWEVLSLLKVLSGLGDGVYRRISEVHIAGSGEIVLFTVEGSVPVMIGTGDYGRKLATLAAFWNQVASRTDIRLLERIDLRYREQVVVRWKEGIRRSDRGSDQKLKNEQAFEPREIAVGEKKG